MSGIPLVGQTNSLDGVYSVSLQTGAIDTPSLTVDNITMSSNEIVSDTGNLSFGSNNVATTGNVQASAVTSTGTTTAERIECDNITIDNNDITSSTTLDVNANGSVVVNSGSSTRPIILRNNNEPAGFDIDLLNDELRISLSGTGLLTQFESDRVYFNKNIQVTGTGASFDNNNYPLYVSHDSTSNVACKMDTTRYGMLIDADADTGKTGYVFQTTCTPNKFKINNNGLTEITTEENGLKIDTFNDSDASGYGLKVSTVSGAEVTINNDASINVAGTMKFNDTANQIDLVNNNSYIRFGTGYTWPTTQFIRNTNDNMYIDCHTKLFLRERGSTMIECAAGASQIRLIQYTASGTLSLSGTGNIFVSSDERLKQNIEDSPYGLNEILQLRPRKYQLKMDPDNDKIGFIAQETEHFIPEAVDGKKIQWEWEQTEEGKPKKDENGNLIFKKDDDGNKIPRYRGFDDTAILATLVKAVQELSAKNDLLEERISKLENK